MSDLPRYGIVITSTAISEIEDICIYIEGHSPQNAALMARRFIKAIDSLRLLPRRYKRYAHPQDKTKTVHAMTLSPFIIYYRVDEPLRRVRILSVRHGARRQPKRFQ